MNSKNLFFALQLLLFTIDVKGDDTALVKEAKENASNALYKAAGWKK